MTLQSQPHGSAKDKLEVQDLLFCISARENLGSHKANILCWYHAAQNIYQPQFVWHIPASFTLDTKKY